MVGSADSDLPQNRILLLDSFFSRRYIFLFLAALIVVALTLPNLAWENSAQEHTVLETIATTIAFVIGGLALVRYYSKKSNRYLFLGVGFLGTSIFDGMHTLLTVGQVASDLPSNFITVTIWSWTISRIFLGMLMVLAVLNTHTRQTTRSVEVEEGAGHERVTQVRRVDGDPVYEIEEPQEILIFTTVVLLALFCLAFFLYMPLPRATYPNLFIMRPQEIAPALLFAIAAIIHYRSLRWRYDIFEYWLLLALVASLAVDAFFMIFSTTIFDSRFNYAHIGKIVSYLLVLSGLGHSLFDLVRRVEITAEKLSQSNLRLNSQINERVQVERQLRASEARLADAQRVAQVGSWEWDIPHDRVTWSDEMYRIYGYEAQARPIDFSAFASHLHPEDVERVQERLNLALQDGEPFSFYHRIVQVDGTVRILQARGQVEFDEQGAPYRMWGTGQDVTERRIAEERLQRSEMQLAQAQRLAQIGYWEWVADRNVILLSPELRKILGIDPETTSLTSFRMLSLIHTNDRRETLRTFRNACHTKERFHLKVRIAAPEKQVRFLDLIGNVVVDESGEVASMWGTGQDVTRIRQVEQQLRGLADRLESSNRELQDFAYIASHDLQEPLRKIIAFGGRLRQKYNDQLDDTGRDYLGRMQHAARRMQTLIEDLLELSRVTTRGQEFVDVDLNKIVGEIILDLETRIEETEGQVQTDKLPTLQADPLQMRQLFQNLISNALKFHKPGVPPVVRVSVSSVDDAERITPAYRIVVSDNGIGFDEKYRDRIFLPFQRLHGRNTYEGTGMGLAICRKIVERHQGTIEVESEPEKGTKFCIYLPAEQVKGES